MPYMVMCRLGFASIAGRVWLVVRDDRAERLTNDA